MLLGYPVGIEMLTRGRSAGKALLGLRVVRDDGGPVRFRQALTRGLVGAAIEWPGIVAPPLTWLACIWTMVVSPHGQAAGRLRGRHARHPRAHARSRGAGCPPMPAGAGDLGGHAGPRRPGRRPGPGRAALPGPQQAPARARAYGAGARACAIEVAAVDEPAAPARHAGLGVPGRRARRTAPPGAAAPGRRAFPRRAGVARADPAQPGRTPQQRLSKKQLRKPTEGVAVAGERQVRRTAPRPQ